MVTGSMWKPAIGCWSVIYLDGRQRDLWNSIVADHTLGADFCSSICQLRTFPPPCQRSSQDPHVSGRAIDRRNTYIRLHLKEHGVTPRTPEKRTDGMTHVTTKKDEVALTDDLTPGNESEQERRRSKTHQRGFATAPSTRKSPSSGRPKANVARRLQRVMSPKSFRSSSLIRSELLLRVSSTLRCPIC